MRQPSVLHVVVTENFAGTERYVCDVASETASHGWRVAVVGGDSARMRSELADGVRWLPGSSIPQALRSVERAGRHNVFHAHLTYAEAVGAMTSRLHRGRLVSTRHLAASRGSSRAGKLMAPWIAHRIEKQIAISNFVDGALERPADSVLLNGTPSAPLRWRPESRRVLVLQRLEPEKDTATALEAWRRSALADCGWTMRIVGDGAQLQELRSLASGLPAVEFTGQTRDVAAEFDRAGIMLATAPAEPFGLSVVEAMAAGVPVVAAGAAGHLETVGALHGSAIFSPGDPVEAAQHLTELAHDHGLRQRLSHKLRSHQQQKLTLAGHVDRLLSQYPRS